jgi:iron(III) transport system permease protein
MMAVLLYDPSEAGDFEVLSALGFILLAMTLVLVGIGVKLVGRDFMLRRT